MATMKDTLAQLESRVATLENYTGLLRHRQQEEAQRLQAEHESRRHTPFGGLPGEEEALRIMVEVAPHMRQVSDICTVAGAANRAGFRNRRGREFSVQDVKEILKRKGFRLPVYGVGLQLSDQGMNEALARDLLRRLSKPIAAATGAATVSEAGRGGLGDSSQP